MTLSRSFVARHAMGARVRGIALAARDGFSARYDLDRQAGVFSRPQHTLVGHSYVGRVLVLDTSKGGVASAWMLAEMRSRDRVPLAIVFNSVNPILVQGAAFADLPMLAGFDVDITAEVESGDEIELDPDSKTLTIVTRAARPAALSIPVLRSGPARAPGERS
jgi:predicted aconitase with swiveling domain